MSDALDRVREIKSVGGFAGRLRSVFPCRHRSRLMTFSNLVATFSRFEVSSRRIPNQRIQPGDDVHATAWMIRSGNGMKRRTNTHEPADYREHCQHRKRHPH